MHDPRGYHVEEAGRLYGLAAQGGSIEGMYSLGWMHAMGLGMPQNTIQAVALYRQAVEQAPDWQHAAPPFTALLLLPGMLALQALHPFLPSVTGLQATGETRTSFTVRHSLCSAVPCLLPISNSYKYTWNMEHTEQLYSMCFVIALLSCLCCCCMISMYFCYCYDHTCFLHRRLYMCSL